VFVKVHIDEDRNK